MIRSVELLPLAWEGLLNIKHYVAEAFDEKTADTGKEGGVRPYR